MLKNHRPASLSNTSSSIIAIDLEEQPALVVSQEALDSGGGGLAAEAGNGWGAHPLGRRLPGSPSDWVGTDGQPPSPRKRPDSG